MPDPSPQVTPSQRTFGKLALLLVVLALIGNVLAFAYLRPYAILHDLGPLAEAREYIHARFVGEVNDQALIDAALGGMADALGDPNTAYFSAEQLADFNEHVAGEFTGIGAEIGVDEDRPMIISPLDDSPAFKSGLMPGDVVLEIDGLDTLGLRIEETVDLIKGKAGTVVTLKVRHPDGGIQDIPIERARVKYTTVRGYRRDLGNGYDYMLDPERKIAYLRLTQFGNTSLKEVIERLKQLKAQGMAALILDLRNNPGGLLEGAAGVSDLFLTGGQTIVSTKGKGPAVERIKSSDKTLLPDLPLVILINESSASASEIVAGAILDNNRGLLVGSRSFGKGSVQQVLELDGGDSAIKLTTAHWYMPSGKLIHRQPEATRWGVDPSPGCYVGVTTEELRAMLLKRRESELDDPFAKLDGPVTPQWLRDELLDAPLAAGLDAAQRMLAGEAWPTVGVPLDEALAELDDLFDPSTQRGLLERRKQELLEQLGRVEDRLDEVIAEEAEDAEGQP